MKRIQHSKPTHPLGPLPSVNPPRSLPSYQSTQRGSGRPDSRASADVFLHVLEALTACSVVSPPYALPNLANLAGLAAQPRATERLRRTIVRNLLIRSVNGLEMTWISGWPTRNPALAHHLLQIAESRCETCADRDTRENGSAEGSLGHTPGRGPNPDPEIPRGCRPPPARRVLLLQRGSVNKHASFSLG
jgi:hypothetical protein